MKRILTSLLIVTALVLSQSIFASEWRPIAEITDFEKGIIAIASRKYADHEINKALAFRVKNDLIELLLIDGSVKYYGANTTPEINGVEETQKSSEPTESQQKRFVENRIKERIVKGLLGEFLDLLNDGDTDIKDLEATSELLLGLIGKTEQEQILSISDILKKAPSHQIALELEAKLLSRTLDGLYDLDKVKIIDRLVEILEQMAPIKNQNRQNREENYHFATIYENGSGWSLPSPFSEIFSALLTLRSLEKNYPQLAPQTSFNQALNILESKGIRVTRNP